MLGYDSDFLVLNMGGALYLSLKSLRFTKTGVQLQAFDGARVAPLLGLERAQLPVLAGILGTDFRAASEPS